MKKYILPLLVAGSVNVGTAALANENNDPTTTPKSYKIVITDGLYFTDETQNKLYTGDYREYYDDGTLKAEIYIKDGNPEGLYVIYHPNGTPQEIRSYRNGVAHGNWRIFNVYGKLISEANYYNNQKHGVWRVWDDNGTLRYEMFYTDSKRSGLWQIWDEQGTLISSKSYDKINQ